jgi:hypothetical protein
MQIEATVLAPSPWEENLDMDKLERVLQRSYFALSVSQQFGNTGHAVRMQNDLFKPCVSCPLTDTASEKFLSYSHRLYVPHSTAFYRPSSVIEAGCLQNDQSPIGLEDRCKADFF